MNTELLPAFMCNIASRVVWLRQAIELDPELKKVAHKLARYTAPMQFEAELLSGKMEQVQKVVDKITKSDKHKGSKAALFRSVPCPRCGAPVGEHCRTLKTALRNFSSVCHSERIIAAQY
jgi:hypothetical protein